MSDTFDASTAPSNFINGAWLPGSGAELVTIDPSDGRQTWASLAATASDVQQVAKAHADGDALIDGRVGPRVKGAARGLASLFDLCWRRFQAGPRLLAVRRVDGEQFAARAWQPGAVDEVRCCGR